MSNHPREVRTGGKVTDGALARFDGTDGSRLKDSSILAAQGSAITSLTDSTGGTADDTLAAISGSGADAAINNNFADLAAKVEEILAAMRASGRIAT